MKAETPFAPLLLPERVTYRPQLQRLAYWISQIGSPPLLGFVGALVIGQRLGTAVGWWQVGLYASLTLLLPLAYIFWLLRRGLVSDFHLPRREERLKPMRLSLVTAVIGWLLLFRLAAPPLLLALSLANLGQSLLYFGITRYWKISIHTAVAAGLAVLVWHTWGLLAWPLLAAVPLVAWSRVYLRRHTVAQTVAGVGVGAFVLLLSLLWHGA